MPVQTIAVENGQVKIIDQTLLPTRTKYLTVETIDDMWEAIKILRVRGAPAIGIAAAFGLYLGVKDSPASDFGAFYKDVEKAADYLASSRPTAVNLFWALDRVKRVVCDNASLPVDQLKKRIFQEGVDMVDEDNRVCRAIGEYGETLLKDGDGVLTHCNAGGLATAQYGTALAPIYIAKEKGKNIHVYSDETRPLLQGARLTAWELREEGIPVTLICDNMAATVMAKGWIQAVIVGTDRTVANGDVANKIGTYGVAILAKAHHIPFYVAVPTSTIDMSLSDGSHIPIEERAPEEIACSFGRRIAPEGIDIYNPAFDVTPHEYVTALITEKGIVRPPYDVNLKKIMA
ncbi:MAG: S-methyl-5-thioribose-1-phosphate isomerase [Candidatus Omnitrophota bacterium]